MKLTNQIVPVVLSGGAGTRLWPLSRSVRPKQFIELIDSSSLFQMTLGRLGGIPNLLPPIVVCNEAHRFTVAEQLEQDGIIDRSILLEPASRNTAPAIASAALFTLSNMSSIKPLMLVLPADHVIGDEKEFRKAVVSAMVPASKGKVVTFGIKPDRPAVGYGYIRAGSFDEEHNYYNVEKFVEKPDEITAAKYLKDTKYFWNAGIFLVDPSVLIDELSLYSPEIQQYSRQAFEAAELDRDFIRLDKVAYARCKSDSLDCAVLESSKRVAMVPMDVRWSDVGSWSSVWEYEDKDETGNVKKGDIWVYNVKNSYLHAENKIIAAVGVEDLIIVETLDGVLVAKRSADEDVKKIVEQLIDANRSEAMLHRKVYRPWGYYDSLDFGQRFQVKRICVKPGGTLSLQKHYHRAEHWIVVSGTAEITCDDKVLVLTENESTHIPLGSIHCLTNPGKIPLEMIEVQSGSYLGEDDIIRLEDAYGRKE